jgi:glycosyltransferase involved in cell wall biosynthesis
MSSADSLCAAGRGSMVRAAVKKKLLFVVNVDWFFASHRLPVALAAIESGYEVHLAAALTDAQHALRAAGIIVHPLPISRSGTNVFAELRAIGAIGALYRRVRPDVVHLVTSKSVLYGGLMARIARVPAVVASISGLGYVFIASSLKSRLIRAVASLFYRLALGRPNVRVIFQNPDDRDIFFRLCGLSAEKAVMIRGSGVELGAYRSSPEPNGVPVVAMAARLLWDKGTGEYVEAARLLRNAGIDARFLLIGDPDIHNPACVPPEVIEAWKAGQFVELLGFRSDIAELFSGSHVVVLPSYREGLPKVLIEAAACGRAVVTTDVPGCRDAIVPGKTGLLVPVRDAVALAEAIRRLLEDHRLRQSMGQAARELAEEAFDVRKVVDQHLTLYRLVQA